MGRTIARMFLDAVREGDAKTAYLHKGASTWQKVSFAEAGARAEALGNGLLKLGLTKGDRVAILSNTRLEWSLADYAILGGGMITVPIYQTNSSADCEYILQNSGAKAIFVEDAEQLEKIASCRESLPELKHIILITGVTEGDVLTYEAVERSGHGGAEWRVAAHGVTPEDTATYIYTSGTTGPPKGCVLTHSNYAEMTEMVVDAGDIFMDDDRIMMFLPLAHTFARLVHFVTTRMGIELAYAQSIPTLMDDIGDVQPTILPSVPRIFEKAHTTILGKAMAGSSTKVKLFNWAIRTGRLRTKYVQHGRRVPPALALQYGIASKLVFSKIQARFGGKMRMCISGGAPLNKEIAEFFWAAGLPILEGYGLTECTTAATLNRPDKFRLGSVGPALPRCELKIADDGEILIAGPHIFQGYYGNDEATAEVLTDGWLHSGDIGVIDEDGFLVITDRKKDLIVTAGGKNVAPQNIEGALKSTQYISQAYVHGDQRPYIAALITLDPQEMEAFATEHGLPTEMDKLVAEEKVQQLVKRAVDEVNSNLSKAEQVKRYRILPVDFLQETGELTPTLKVKRKVIREKYDWCIDEMYDKASPDAAPITELREPTPA